MNHRRAAWHHTTLFAAVSLRTLQKKYLQQFGLYTVLKIFFYQVGSISEKNLPQGEIISPVKK